MFSPDELSALYLSAKVAGFATLFCLPFSIALAWVLARHEFRLKFMVEALLQLPMVLPPVVLGYMLLVLFGNQGFIGKILNTFGIQLAFNWKGAVLASMIVAFPLMVQPIRLSFQLMNQQLEHIAGSLGAAPWKVFLTINLPLAIPGIVIGSILCFSRSLGEFGATITFVGNIASETRTLPLAMYSLMQQPDTEAAVWRLIILSLSVAFFALWFAQWFNRYQKNKRGH